MSDDCDSSCGCAGHAHGGHSAGSRLTLELAIEVDGPLAGKFPGTDEAAYEAAILDAAGAVSDCSGLLPDGNLSVTILLATDEMVADLNASYRGKNKPTNVLSFPSPAGFPAGPDGVRHLGDIVFAAETVAAEAVEMDRHVLDHLRHLTVHGLLHLLGLDHENDEDAERMEQLEARLLSSIGVADPYAGSEPAAS